MLTQLLASPQFAAFVSGLILTVLWAVVGKVGSALESLGESRGIVALVVIGKRLEALGYDGPKLQGKPGAPEPGAAVNAAVEKAVADALRSKEGS